MRKVFLLANLVVAISLCSAQLFADEIIRIQPTPAGDCGCSEQSSCGDTCGDSCCGSSCKCGLWSKHCGSRRRNVEGRDAWFNCGCNGSYKFPVPPLSTYHWPGLYSHQLMTDYHSPWRFPPVKPLPERRPSEPASQVELGQPSLLPVRAISNRTRSARRSTGIMSDKMDELFQ